MGSRRRIGVGGASEVASDRMGWSLSPLLGGSLNRLDECDELDDTDTRFQMYMLSLQIHPELKNKPEIQRHARNYFLKRRQSCNSSIASQSSPRSEASTKGETRRQTFKSA